MFKTEICCLRVDRKKIFTKAVIFLRFGIASTKLKEKFYLEKKKMTLRHNKSRQQNLFELLQSMVCGQRKQMKTHIGGDMPF